MHSSSLLVAALVAGALALPPQVGPKAGSFSVKQVRNTKFSRRNGPLALAKAYLKFGAKMPSDLQTAIDAIMAELGLEKRSTGTATTTPEQFDTEYLTPVSIGTPAQVLNLDFDTGSSDLWVFSSETPSSETSGHGTYSPNDSSSAKRLSGASWNITYGDGSSSSGDVYTDIVSVGGLKVSSQAVESAKQVSTQFVQDTDSDGLLGLAFSSINTVTPTQQNTFFDNAISSLNSPVFTADLRHDQPGKYSFGFIDSIVSNGSITYTDVDSSQGFWMFSSPAYAIGSGSKTSTPISGIADTGTTLLLLPDSTVKQYYKQVSDAKYDNTQGGYVFPCSTTPPSFSYFIGSTKITIPGDFINFSPVTEGSSSCFGGIQSDAGIGFAIYGDVALKAAFVVFDGSDSPRLGFAPKST